MGAAGTRLHGEPCTPNTTVFVGGNLPPPLNTLMQSLFENSVKFYWTQFLNISDQLAMKIIDSKLTGAYYLTCKMMGEIVSSVETKEVSERRRRELREASSALPRRLLALHAFAPPHPCSLSYVLVRPRNTHSPPSSHALFLGPDDFQGSAGRGRNARRGDGQAGRGREGCFN